MKKRTNEITDLRNWDYHSIFLSETIGLIILCIGFLLSQVTKFGWLIKKFYNTTYGFRWADLIIIFIRVPTRVLLICWLVIQQEKNLHKLTNDLISLSISRKSIINKEVQNDVNCGGGNSGVLWLWEIFLIRYMKNIEVKEN